MEKLQLLIQKIEKAEGLLLRIKHNATWDIHVNDIKEIGRELKYTTDVIINILNNEQRAD